MKHIRKTPPVPSASTAETPARRTVARTRLFHFTDREELMMARAIWLSKKFMETYGRGYKPHMVDIRHYIQ